MDVIYKQVVKGIYYHVSVRENTQRFGMLKSCFVIKYHNLLMYCSYVNFINLKHLTTEFQPPETLSSFSNADFYIPNLSLHTGFQIV